MPFWLFSSYAGVDDDWLQALMRSIGTLRAPRPAGERIDNVRRSVTPSRERGLQFADDVVPQLLGQVVAHAVEQHQPGTL